MMQTLGIGNEARQISAGKDPHRNVRIADRPPYPGAVTRERRPDKLDLVTATEDLGAHPRVGVRGGVTPFGSTGNRSIDA